MPRNITTVDVAKLKGEENMGQCGIDALGEAQDGQAARRQALAAALGGGAEPEPEPEPLEEGDETLQQAFLRAEQLCRQVGSSDLPTVHPDLQKLVAQCLAKLAACQEMVRAQNVFSPNEDAEDIKTADLKYLLLPHLNADMMLRRATPGGAADRLKLLAPALAEWNVFVTELEKKGLVSPEDLVVLQREDGARLDAAMLRDEKIARLKRDKAETEHERQLIMKRRAILAAARGDEALAEDDSELEEVERALSKLQLDKAIRSAINQIKQTKEELEMLQMMAGRALPPREVDDRSRPRKAQPMLRIDKQSSLGVGARLTQQMSMQQQVYNPKLGYTMMPEEWAEREMALNAQKEVNTQPHTQNPHIRILLRVRESLLADENWRVLFPQHAEIVAKHDASVEQNSTFGVRGAGLLNADGRTMAYSGENGHEVRCLPCLALPTKPRLSFSPCFFPFFILVLASAHSWICTFMDG